MSTISISLILYLLRRILRFISVVDFRLDYYVY